MYSLENIEKCNDIEELEDIQNDMIRTCAVVDCCLICELQVKDNICLLEFVNDKLFDLCNSPM